MARLRGKVPKRRHKTIKDDLRGRGWAFYLDRGMPWLAEFIGRTGAQVETAEDGAGADAPDDAHLKLARKAGQVFVTRDERLIASERDNLIGSPGILVLKAHTGGSDDLIALFAGSVLALRGTQGMRERIVVASRAQVKVYEADGTSWSLPAE